MLPRKKDQQSSRGYAFRAGVAYPRASRARRQPDAATKTADTCTVVGQGKKEGGIKRKMTEGKCFSFVTLQGKTGVFYDRIV